MKIDKHKISLLNETVYNELTGILKKINKRIYIKMYALVYETEEVSTPVKIIRIKKTVSINKDSTLVSQDTLQTLTNVYSEIKIDSEIVGSSFAQIKSYMDQKWYNEFNQANQGNIVVADSSSIQDDDGGINSASNINDTRILYAGQISLKDGESSCLVTYILEIRNADNETKRTFYERPAVSFLRMILDYFFSDYFLDDIKISKDEITQKNTINRKYNEDGAQFNRRLARLFLGKLQSYIQDNYSDNEFKEEFENKLNNQYYVNSLLEKIEDVSTLTYESSSPFGSILFMNKEVILKTPLISFAVTFTEEDRIHLDDAKRIRKLLELTNIDKDLCLIADENEIYGLGVVKWNLQREVEVFNQKGAFALRLDLTGLSKYSLVLVQSSVDPASNGELLIENGEKIYRSDLKLIETELLSVSFKNPRLGEEGYSSEKFTSLLKNVFWGQVADIEQVKFKVDRLDQIVRQAREQKHGTMVVITDHWTAKQELDELRKQSTLIDPKGINKDYIKFLTSIDGAIYFDTEGNCHAIGVILDGKAKQDIGNASRGARFNSAHRYLHKLKDFNTNKPVDEPERKCVIVIISEDGSVDLIPELENEEMLLGLSEEIIDLINEKSSEQNKLDRLFEKEEVLLCSPIVDSDWLFKIGEAHYENKSWVSAISFFERGKALAEESYIPPLYLNLLGICYACIEKYTDAKNSFELAIKSESDFVKKIVYTGNIGINFVYHGFKLEKSKLEFIKAIEYLTKSIELGSNLEDPRKQIYLSHRGRSYLELANLEADPSEKNGLLIKSTEDYKEAINLNDKDNTYYWFRHKAYKGLNQISKCIKDLIQAEYIKHNDNYIKTLNDLLDSDINHVTETVDFYKKLVSQNNRSEGTTQLNELMSELEIRLELGKATEEAAVHKEIQVDEDSKS